MIEKFTTLAEKSPRITALTLLTIVLIICFGFYAVTNKYKVTKEGIEPINEKKIDTNCSKIHALEISIDSVIAHKLLYQITDLQAIFKDKPTIENRENLIHYYAVVVQLNRYRLNDLKLLEEKCKNGESFDENFKAIEVSVTTTIEKTEK
jgi:Zn-dependent peptidase ImmA (M78 family)